MMFLPTILAALAVGSVADAKVYHTRFPGVKWDAKDWTITNTDLVQGEYESRMSLANGYLGINVAALGPFFEVDKPVAGDVISGWPLFDRRQTFATIAGFYDSQATTNGTNFAWLYQYGGESVISGVPHWAGLHVELGGQVLYADTPSSQISNFQNAVDFQNGLMTWKYTWNPTNGSSYSNGSGIDIEYTMFVNKLYVNQATVQLKMTAQKDMTATVIDVLNGDCAVRSEPVDKQYETNQSVIWSAVNPHWLPDIQAYIYSQMVGDNSTDTSSRSQYTKESVIGGNSSSIAQAVNVRLRAGKTSTITKYIGGASSDAYDHPQYVAQQACSKGAKEGYNKLLHAHKKEWHSIMSKDTVEDYSNPDSGDLPDDPNVIELAITAVTSPFHLLQNTIGSNALDIAGNDKPLDVNSISVAGLGSDSYAGWIFWDAEVWMAPGLAVAYPQAAKQIAAYRAQKLSQAQKNIETAYQSSQNKTNFSPNGAVFPWTSGRYGNCTAGGPCFDYEYHINGDIGLELYNYYVVTGDTDYFQNELFPVYDAVAQFYADLVTYNSTAGKYYLFNATDPDEYANFETNVGYTMVLMETHIDNTNVLRERFGESANSSWSQVANKIEVPVDSSANIIKEYQTMNGSIQVKQADVVLIDDFLSWPNPYAESDLTFYAGKQSLNGPGMTYAVFSINANKLSQSGCASYTYDLYGSQPYIRAPWYQFSEQLVDNFQQNGGTHPAFPFLTGIGGANRVAIFGYLGLKLMLDSLNVDPNLPPQIPNLKYRTFYWQGWPIQAQSNQTHTTLTRLTNGSLSSANSTFESGPIPVTVGDNFSLSGNNTVYYLTPGGSITLTNRQIGNVQTVPGNIAQCRPVTSTQAYEPGQFPLSAVDGAVSTKWQPTQLNETSSITVELSDTSVPITAIKFDWAQSPPTSYKVTFSNSSNGANAVTVTSSSNVIVSNPYIAANADEITPYMSNTTNVTLSSPVYSRKYATLYISGNQALVGTADAKNGTGASVAEFAIVSANGTNLIKRAGRVRLA